MTDIIEIPLVLITDDNPNNIKVAGSTIATLGYNIAVAQNGENTIEFAKKSNQIS